MQDCPCLFFATPTGELQPYGRADLMVECKPQQVGRLRSQLELLVERRTIRYTLFGSFILSCEADNSQVC